MKWEVVSILLTTFLLPHRNHSRRPSVAASRQSPRSVLSGSYNSSPYATYVKMCVSANVYYTKVTVCVSYGMYDTEVTVCVSYGMYDTEVTVKSVE